jgi:hypothetical protein
MNDDLTPRDSPMRPMWTNTTPEKPAWAKIIAALQRLPAPEITFHATVEEAEAAHEAKLAGIPRANITWTEASDAVGRTWADFPPVRVLLGKAPGPQPPSSIRWPGGGIVGDSRHEVIMSWEQLADEQAIAKTGRARPLPRRPR